VRERLNKLIERVSGKRLGRRPASAKPIPKRGAQEPSEARSAPVTPIPHDDRTGYTVHRDVALRLKNLSINLSGESPIDPGREVGAFKIRLAGSLQVRWDACSLVQQRYAGKGYKTSGPPANPNVCTFAAYDEGRLAGTVSLRLDSSDGLASDEIYGDEIAQLRADGRRLCEFTRLAVDVSRVSKPVLAGLFHTVYLYATKLRNFDYVVIEVNPRHVGYYKNSLGFKVIGPERLNQRVQAPAVLMGMSFEEIADHLHNHAAKAGRTAKTHSLYEYGFSPAEEAGILGRLKTLPVS